VRRIAALAITLLVIAGCTSPSGVQPTPTLPVPAPLPTATLAGAPTAAPTGATPAPATETTMPGPLTLTSPSFADGASIPKQFTCDGDNVSPPLQWAGVPGAATSLALVVTDPDARGFVHWVVYDMDVSATGGIQAGWSTTADAAPQGENGFGDVGWGGPCPPSGTHRYLFRLLALDTILDLRAGPSADDVLTAAEGHVLGEVTLTGTYTRG
jgi:Raf kinase inhibitor-like YbhB/YbcL family protein